MSKGPNASSSRRVKRDDRHLARPFDPVLLERARRIAASYYLILEPDDELGFIGHALELPTGFAHGSTPDKCVKATREGLTVAVATMLEMGQRPPAPASKGRRQAQINIRVNAEEKLILEESARRNGFRGVSDFVRFAALERTTTPKAPSEPRP